MPASRRAAPPVAQLPTALATSLTRSVYTGLYHSVSGKKVAPGLSQRASHGGMLQGRAGEGGWGGGGAGLAEGRRDGHAVVAGRAVAGRLPLPWRCRCCQRCCVRAADLAHFMMVPSGMFHLLTLGLSSSRSVSVAMPNCDRFRQ